MNEYHTMFDNLFQFSFQFLENKWLLNKKMLSLEKVLTASILQKALNPLKEQNSKLCHHNLIYNCFSNIVSCSLSVSVSSINFMSIIPFLAEFSKILCLGRSSQNAEIDQLLFTCCTLTGSYVKKIIPLLIKGLPSI